MDFKQAKEFLAILADGVDPTTGELLPEDDCCNKVEVVRALHAALSALDIAAKRQRTVPENAGKPWSADEEESVVTEYKSGVGTRQIAKTHGRSSVSIASRLVKLGIIKTRTDAKQ